MTGATDWRGRVGDVWAQEHARTERAFAGIASVLNAAIVAAAPDHGAAIDLGCGIGSTTQALSAARPALRVTGIDLSPALIAVAEEQATTAGGAPRFLAGDAVELVQTLAPLDLLVSRHGLMFFADPLAAFAALRAAAAPRAPLVFSCFASRDANEWVTAPEAAVGLSPLADAGYSPGPFALSDGAFTRALLEESGWTEIAITPACVPYVVGAGVRPVEDALDFYRRIGPLAAMLASALPADRERIETRLRNLFAMRIQRDAVTFSAAIWIVTARAGKEA
ncbi:MAG: class I SAM-dependent methyltransferase [Sphingomonas phyllosphaerae]|uniref:class I SAM-dependent methyltransferase n=1 Tax=Sphingomonas phyllosphaerae TaxID=257003 RepID=UPI002FF59F62